MADPSCWQDIARNAGHERRVGILVSFVYGWKPVDTGLQAGLSQIWRRSSSGVAKNPGHAAASPPDAPSAPAGRAATYRQADGERGEAGSVKTGVDSTLHQHVG